MDVPQCHGCGVLLDPETPLGDADGVVLGGQPLWVPWAPSKMAAVTASVDGVRVAFHSGCMTKALDALAYGRMPPPFIFYAEWYAEKLRATEKAIAARTGVPSPGRIPHPPEETLTAPEDPKAPEPLIGQETLIGRETLIGQEFLTTGEPPRP